MKIGIITTIDTNIGDDFIRCGIENLIKNIVGEENVYFTYVNKHYPSTSIKQTSILGILYRVRRFKGKARIIKWFEKNHYHRFSLLREQDLIIQSGAPVLWPDCNKNEWAELIWYNTIGKLYKSIPVLNIAAGACYPWEMQGEFNNKADEKYAYDIGNFCSLTTTRDRLAHTLFNSVQIRNVLLPCTAFFVSTNKINDFEKKYILINYMEGAGHYDWNQSIDKSLWEEIVIFMIKELMKVNKVCFLCHDQKEVEVAEKLNLGLDIFYPKTVAEYLTCIQYAQFGINNRMHASVAMSSFGIPTISVCTDTRLLMLENIGATYYYVKDVQKESILSKTLSLIDNAEDESKRLFELKSTKFNDYVNLLSGYLK